MIAIVKKILLHSVQVRSIVIKFPALDRLAALYALGDCVRRSAKLKRGIRERHETLSIL